jgi:hypothetical protein
MSKGAAAADVPTIPTNYGQTQGRQAGQGVGGGTRRADRTTPGVKL